MHESLKLLGSALAGGAVTCAAWVLLTSRSARVGDSSEAGASKKARIVTMPHPEWVPGAQQPHPFSSDTWIPCDPLVEDKARVYPLVISAVVPRPIALVSSCNSEGEVNLAPYSYFNAMSNNPMVVCIGIVRAPGRTGGQKDTMMNIQATGEFVINIMSEWYIEAANHSCGDFDHGVDELALAGLTPIPSLKVKPPRVKESALHMECKLMQVIDLHDTSGTITSGIVLAQVVMIHVHEGVAAKSPTGKLVVDPLKLQPICRLGGTYYGRVTELFDLGRPVKSQAHLGPAEYTPSYVAAKAAANS